MSLNDRKGIIIVSDICDFAFKRKQGRGDREFTERGKCPPHTALPLPVIKDMAEETKYRNKLNTGLKEVAENI